MSRQDPTQSLLQAIETNNPIAETLMNAHPALNKIDAATLSQCFTSMILHKHYDLAELFLSKRLLLNVNWPTRDGDTPLHLLISHLETIVNPQQNNPLQAAHNETKTDLDGNNDKPIEQIKRLINLLSQQRGVRFDATNHKEQKAFDLAQNSSIIVIFLENKYFMKAAKSWIKDDLSKRLLVAVVNGHYEHTEFLISHKADVNIREKQGRELTCLHLVARKDPRMIALLLNAKADPTLLSKPDTYSKKGFTPIELANGTNMSESTKWDCVEAFAKNYQSSNDDSAHFGSSLGTAIVESRYDTALLLLQAKASIRWSIGDMSHLHRLVLALDQAYFDNHNDHIHKITRLIYLLLNAGAGIAQKTRSNDKTPLELALALAKHPEVISLLQNPKLYKFKTNPLTVEDESSASVVAKSSVNDEAQEKPQQPIQAAIYIFNITLFCQEYQHGITRLSSASSIAFVNLLQTMVTENGLELYSTKEEVKSISDKITDFANKNKGKKNKQRIMSLMATFQLWSEEKSITSSPSSDEARSATSPSLATAHP